MSKDVAGWPRHNYIGVINLHPYQEIFNAVFKICLDSGFDTVTELPNPSDGQDLSRFFVYVGEQYGQDEYNKSAVFGTVNQTIHVYGPIDNRINILNTLEEILYKLRRLTRTQHYYLRISNTSQRINKDTSTAVTMWHGLIDVGIKFY